MLKQKKKAYRIADLERLSGVRAHTIRIWEKRYGLMRPGRTSTNIRRYDDEDLRRLLNVSLLVQSGMKISEVASLDDSAIQATIQHQSADQGAASGEQAIINDMLTAICRFDEAGFDKAMLTALTRFGMRHTLLNIFYGLLNKIGMAWMTGEVVPIQEHFGSVLIRRKIISAIDALPLPKHQTHVLLFLPENEWHELGLLVAEYLLRSEGYRVTSLGQNVPSENISLAVTAIRPDHLFTIITTRTEKAPIRTLASTLLSQVHEGTLLVAGHPENLSGLPASKKVVQLSAPQDLVTWINSQSTKHTRHS